MSCSHLCIHRNETVQPPYFQNRITMFCLPISTLIYLWEIYIFLGSVCLFCCSQVCGQILGIYKRSQTHECGNWDWGRAIPRKGIHKWNFRCSACAQIFIVVFSFHTMSCYASDCRDYGTTKGLVFRLSFNLTSQRGSHNELHTAKTALTPSISTLHYKCMGHVRIPFMCTLQTKQGEGAGMTHLLFVISTWHEPS